MEPEASPALAISSDDITHSTQELDGEYDSEHEFDVDMPKEDDVDAPCGVDLDRDVDIKGTVTMKRRRMKRRKLKRRMMRRRRIRMRSRIRMMMMANNLGRLAKGRW